MADDKDKIKEALKTLSKEAVELYLGKSVPILKDVPSPLSFYRDYVSHNRPVIIRGGVSHWPALTKWTNHYLRDKIGDQEVTVTATPNGYADAALGDFFMMPEDRKVPFKAFLENIDNPSEDEVCYIQKQNSNLTDEFKDLLEDVDSEIFWASEAFGKSPDAVNFWMGDHRAVTSSKNIKQS